MSLGIGGVEGSSGSLESLSVSWIVWNLAFR